MIRRIMSSRYSRGSIFSARQVCTSERTIAAASPPRSLPTKSQFFRPRAMGRTALSATLLSSGLSSLFMWVRGLDFFVDCKEEKHDIHSM